MPPLRRIAAALAVLLVVVRPCVAAASFAYVTDLSATLTVIDTATNAIVARLHPPDAASFAGVAVNGAGGVVYLADANHTIAVVTSPTNHPTFARIQLDASLTPISVALNWNATTLYVANAGSNTLSVINTRSFAVSAIDLGCDAGGGNNCSSLPPLAVTPVPPGTLPINAYVGTNTGVVVVDTASATVSGTITTTCGPSPCAPLGLAASNDGMTLFASLFEIDQVLGMNVPMMDVIDDIAMVGANPVGLALTPDSNDVYVANLNGRSVSTFNVASCGPICDVTTIGDGIVDQPQVLAVTPDALHVYVGGQANMLSVIDTTTKRVSGTITGLSAPPIAIAMGISDAGPHPPMSANDSNGCSVSPATTPSALPWAGALLLLALRRRALQRRDAEGAENTEADRRRAHDR
jgi:MYXO-CTERM domain-containing protein